MSPCRELTGNIFLSLAENSGETSWHLLRSYAGKVLLLMSHPLNKDTYIFSDEKLAVLVRSLKKTLTECLGTFLFKKNKIILIDKMFSEEYLRWRCVAPRAGAIILSRDRKRTLLVKGRSLYWSFPKGNNIL